MRYIFIILLTVFTISASASEPLSQDGNASGNAQWFGNYGAIAYSQFMGTVGRSWNWSTQYQAEQAAINHCGHYDCQVVVWFRNACGSLAVSRYDRRRFGWAWANQQYDATYRALFECNRLHGSCYTRETVCSF